MLPMSKFARVVRQLKCKDKPVLALGATRLRIFIFAAAVGHDTIGENGECGERLITVAGSLLVAVSHQRNLQLCQLRIPSFSFK